MLVSKAPALVSTSAAVQQPPSIDRAHATAPPQHHASPALQALFTIYKFEFPLTVALLQMAFISPVSYIVARPTLSRELLGTLAPLAMVNVFNVMCGLLGVGF